MPQKNTNSDNADASATSGATSRPKCLVDNSTSNNNRSTGKDGDDAGDSSGHSSDYSNNGKQFLIYPVSSSTVFIHVL